MQDKCPIAPRPNQGILVQSIFCLLELQFDHEYF